MKPIELRGHEKPINVCQFNLDGDLLFTGAAQKKVNVWDTHNFQRIGSYTIRSAVKTLDTTQDSQFLIVGTLEGSVEFFKLQTGASLGFIKRDLKVKYIQLSLGNQFLLILQESYKEGSANSIAIYDFQRLLKSLNPNEKENTDIQPDSEFLDFPGTHFSKVGWNYLNKGFVGTSTEGFLFLLDQKGKVLQKVKAHDGEARNFSFAKDYSLLATCGSDGVKVWDPYEFSLLRVFKTSLPMNSVAISPLVVSDPGEQGNKYHLLMGGGLAARETARSKIGGYEIHLCNIMYEEELGTISGHFGPINTIIFFPDGRGFVSGGEESISRVFQFDDTYWDNEAFK